MTVSSRVTLAVLFCFSLRAQTNLGAINGLVADPSQQVVAEAAIQARSEETGAARTTTSNSLGRFEFPGMAPGEYSIEISAKGFATVLRKVRLEVGQNMRLDFNLTIGDAKTSLEVTSAA